MPLKRVLIAALAVCLTAGVAYAAKDLTLPEKLRKAVEEIRTFSYKQAYELFSQAMDQAKTGSPQWQQAAYGRAVCAQQISPPTKAKMAEAEALYHQLIQASPDSKFAPRAMLNLGRIAELSDYYRDRINLPAARDWYQKVADRWPDKPIAGEAILRVAATYVQSYQEQQVRKGVKVLADWLEKHPKDPLASAMWQYMGDAYFYPLADYDARRAAAGSGQSRPADANAHKRDSYAKALDCYEQADRIGLMEKGREGLVYWRMAVLADRYLKDRKRAIKYYRKIIVAAPTSGKAYEAQLAMKKLGVEPPKIELFEKYGRGWDELEGPGAAKESGQ